MDYVTIRKTFLELGRSQISVAEAQARLRDNFRANFAILSVPKNRANAVIIASLILEELGVHNYRFLQRFDQSLIPWSPIAETTETGVQVESIEQNRRGNHNELRENAIYDAGIERLITVTLPAQTEEEIVMRAGHRILVEHLWLAGEGAQLDITDW